MFTRSLTALAVVLPTLVFAQSQGQAEHLSAPQSEVRAQYQALIHSFMKADFKKFSSFMTADFMATMKGRPSMNRDEVVRDFQKQRDNMTRAKWEKTFAGMDQTGNQMVVKAHGHMVARMRGEDNHYHDFDLVADSIDTWVKVENTWLLSKTDTTSVKVTMDGKSMMG